MPRALDDPSLGARYRGPPPPVILEKNPEPDRALHPASYIRYWIKEFQKIQTAYENLSLRRNEAVARCQHREDDGSLAITECGEARLRIDYVWCNVCSQFITREVARNMFGYVRP